MNVREAYSAWAVTYDSDRNVTRDLDQMVTQKMLAHLRCTVVLEPGCGTGKNTAFLAQIGEQVHAIDFSEGMLAQARAKLPLAHVTFTVADLTHPWPCADQSVDLIVCSLVLEHIADLPFIFAEAFRCLAPRGRFFVCELHPFRQYLGENATFRRDHERIDIPAFLHHISDFVGAAVDAGFTLTSLEEWWHEEDQQAPPRLVSFMFENIG